MPNKLAPPPFHVQEFNDVWRTWLNDFYRFSTELETKNIGEISSGQLNEENSIHLIDASGGVITVALPAAKDVEGVIVHVKKIDASANAVTLDLDGSDTVDGSATNPTTSTQWARLKIISDGSQWLDIL